MPTATPLLLETVRIENGEAFNLPYHQVRFDKSRHDFYGNTTAIDLASHIEAPPKGLYRCRILYAESIRHIEYLPYTPKTIRSLTIVPSDIDYRYKYADRTALDALLQAHPQADEVIIEKDGLLCDTTIANIAFFNGEHWVTPKRPLLEGTMRALFLDKGLLRTADITREHLTHYTHVALMNAMIGFKILNHMNIQYYTSRT